MNCNCASFDAAKQIAVATQQERPAIAARLPLITGQCAFGSLKLSPVLGAWTFAVVPSSADCTAKSNFCDLAVAGDNATSALKGSSGQWGPLRPE